MFLCNIFGCKNICETQSSDRQMLHLHKDKEINKKPYKKEAYSLKHNRKTNTSKNNKKSMIPLHFAQNNVKQFSRLQQRQYNQPFRKTKIVHMYDFKRPSQQTTNFSVNQIQIYPNNQKIKENNQTTQLVYPSNITKHRRYQSSAKNLHSYREKTQLQKPDVVNCQTPSIVSGKISMTSQSTMFTQKPIHNFTKVSIYRPLNTQMSVQDMRVRTQQSSKSTEMLTSQTYPQDNKTFFNNVGTNNQNYAINQSKKMFDNFIITEHEQSSRSMNDQLSRTINKSKAVSNARNTNSSKAQQNQIKQQPRQPISIKLIKQKSNHKKAVRFPTSQACEDNFKQTQKKWQKNSIFKFTNTIRSIEDNSIPSVETSYVDLKFATNPNSYKLFSKLL